MKRILLFTFMLAITSCSTIDYKSVANGYSSSREPAALDRKTCADFLNRFMNIFPGGGRLYLYGERKYQKHFLRTDKFADFSNEVHVLTERGTEVPYQIDIGEAIGVGQFGSVYHLQSLRQLDVESDEGLSLLTVNDNAILKIGNRKIGETLTDKSPFDQGILEEGFYYKDFRQATSEGWDAGHFEIYSDFIESGFFPSVPIYKQIDSDLGAMLVKPYVRGKSVRDLSQKLKPNGTLPKKYVKGLKRIWKMSQVIHKVGQTSKSMKDSTLVPYSLDLKPTNLFWVKKKKEMEKLGLKDPGFVLIEVDHLPQKNWKYDESSMSFERYLKLFIDYIKDTEDSE